MTQSIPETEPRHKYRSTATLTMEGLRKKVASPDRVTLVHGMVAALVSGAGKFALEPSSTNTQWVESTVSVR